MGTTFRKVLTKAMPNTKAQRSRFIKKRLAPFVGMSFRCPALGGKIYIERNSIKETAYNARLSKESTLLATNLRYLFTHATIISHDANVQSNPNKYSKTFINFGFKECFVLKSVHQDYGTAKIVVGKRSQSKLIHYSVTALYIKK